MALVFNPAPGQVQVDTAGHILEPFAEYDVDPADPIAAAAVLAGRIVLVDRRYVDNVRPVDPDATTEES